MRLPTSLSLAIGLSIGTPAVAQELPYEALAERFLADNGRQGASPETFDLHEFLDSEFLHTAAGIFDLYYPVSSARRVSDLEDYQRLVLAVLESQARWSDWLEPVATDARGAQKDHKTLTKWVAAWDLQSLAKGVEKGGRDPLEILGAKSSIVEAAERYSDYVTAGGPLGFLREHGSREPVVLVSDRGDFTRFLCLGGWIYPDHRATYWHPSIVTWTNFYIDDVKVLALQYASPNSSPGNYTGGMSMDYRSPTGLEQQIVQLTANSLFANVYGDRVPPSLAGALAVNLVVDLYGECNTRVDGDLRARRTAAREVFVPGGNPDGGILPPNLADSRWRAEQGSDYFAGALRRALRKSKGVSAFELLDDDERHRTEVNGPFLGVAAAEAAPVGQEFFGDQIEFLRAYRSCFLHWLQADGASSKSKSSKAFAEFLQKLAQNPDIAEIETVFAEVYGGALSSAERDKKELEVRFLKWLEKKR